ncbi:hypothetical protein MUP29_13750, partial [bacterium]|nr:hypothetical protein [bacterium]
MKGEQSRHWRDSLFTIHQTLSAPRAPNSPLLFLWTLDVGRWTALHLDIKAVSLFIIHSFALEPFGCFSEKGISTNEEKNLS